MITQAMITTTVPWTTWLWPGHSTLRSSAIDSRMKLTPQPPPRAVAGRWPSGGVGRHPDRRLLRATVAAGAGDCELAPPMRTDRAPRGGRGARDLVGD